MARPLRLEYAHAVYHVTARGNSRENIYLDDNDRYLFLEVLERVISRMNWRCHAYCLMDNHYHLIIETPDGNLSRGMRELNGVYTQRFNRHHGRVGHIFQGRYKAILVEKDSYLKELARYVVLNPVRAQIVKRASQWKWSSFNSTADKEPSPAWLYTDWLLSQFGNKKAKACKAYQQFVQEGVKAPRIWENLRQQIYLAGETFIKRHQNKIKDKNLTEIPRVQTRTTLPLKVIVQKIKDPYQAMVEAYATGSYSMSEIARHLGVHYSTVSRVVKRAEIGR